MLEFAQLAAEFSNRFQKKHFPSDPPALYGAAEYFLGIGGKRVRPVLCLMGNELFGDIHEDAWQAAMAIELFHNFTLIHDDIMDKAPVRRGVQTVHQKFGDATALLAGDVMLVVAYDYLNKIHASFLARILHLFNKTAKEVCEGQQLDMEFEKRERVSFEEYLHMITLKTSVLLAASLRMGAVIGGGSEGNQQHLYEFGKNLGMAFQVQDDYLDAFGDPAKFGKQPGGDILANKKTFLHIMAMEKASPLQLENLQELAASSKADKVQRTLEIYSACGVNQEAIYLKEKYLSQALYHLDSIAVLNIRKEPLKRLAAFLIQREY